MKTLRLVFVMLLLCLSFPANADSPSNFASEIDSVISDLESVQSDLESSDHTEDDDSDSLGARKAIKQAKKDIRQQAITLMLLSVNPAKQGDLQRVLEATKILGFDLYPKNKLPTK